jgi:uncharacterized protein (TIGR02678 family)
MDASSVQERQQAVRALLAKPLLVASDEAFTSVRKHQDWISNWFAHHAGWQIATSAETVRLRKTPPDSLDSTRPCRNPKTLTSLTRRGYTYLCLALASLVRADRQTTLGNIANEIGANLRAEPRFAVAGLRAEVDTRDERRELVGAIRLLLDWGVLARVHDDEERFITDASADALYNVNRSVLTLLLASVKPPSIAIADTFEERLAAVNEPIFEASEEAQHRFWRTRIFRRLLDDPVLYYDSLLPEEKTYLDRQRSSILREIEEATGLIREVRAEGIAMVDQSGKLTDYRLPEEGTVGHLSLLLTEYLADLARKGVGAFISLEEIIVFSRDAIETHRGRWRKDVTQPGQDRVLTEMILGRLEALFLIRREGDRIVPLAALGRYGLKSEEVPQEIETQASLF